jgi:uncharacterized protein DUF1360
VKPLDLAVDALATSRLTRLVVEDAVLDDVRDHVWKTFPVDSTKVGYLISCRACTSVWVAGLVASGLLPRRIRYIVALSELTILARAALRD